VSSTPTPQQIKQNALANVATVKPALVIPKIPFVSIPKRVSDAFPELSAWHKTNHAALEAWRVQTNVAIFGAIPPP
jgi:hypothetical protein